jgi:hexosaminidase
MADISMHSLKSMCMRTMCITGLAVIATFPGFAQEKDTSFPGVIPAPQHVSLRNTSFVVSKQTKIVLGSNSHQEQFDAEQINEELKKWNSAALQVQTTGSRDSLRGDFIFIGGASVEPGMSLLRERKGTFSPEMKKEGYFLDVDQQGIVVLAESEAGKFNGVMSLLQLMRVAKTSVSVRGISIQDFPLHPIRGLTDDISRGQVSTMANFKKIIRFIARYKMNVYSPYLEDMIAFKKHPLIGKGRGALTTE